MQHTMGSNWADRSANDCSFAYQLGIFMQNMHRHKKIYNICFVHWFDRTISVNVFSNICIDEPNFLFPMNCAFTVWLPACCNKNMFEPQTDDFVYFCFLLDDTYAAGTKSARLHSSPVSFVAGCNEDRFFYVFHTFGWVQNEQSKALILAILLISTTFKICKAPPSVSSGRRQIWNDFTLWHDWIFMMQYDSVSWTIYIYTANLHNL